MALLGKRDEEEYITFGLDIGEGLLIFYFPSLKNGEGVGDRALGRICKPDILPKW
jgi:hypothetical protein